MGRRLSPDTTTVSTQTEMDGDESVWQTLATMLALPPTVRLQIRNVMMEMSTWPDENIMHYVLKCTRAAMDGVAVAFEAGFEYRGESGGS